MLLFLIFARSQRNSKLQLVNAYVVFNVNKLIIHGMEWFPISLHLLHLVDKVQYQRLSSVP